MTPQVLICVGVVALVALVLLARHFWKRGGSADYRLRVDRIDVASLGESGPPDGAVTLDFYHVPVRLALLVLAPVGRDATLPDSSRLPELIDQLTPGLMRILEVHQPRFQRWPPQLSSEGFMNAFFNHVSLPGDKGKGTPWCSIAGKFEADGHPYLTGMVCRAATRNSLGQVEIEHAGKWLDVLRVRSRR